ncbi:MULTISPECIES: hypothetical protein [unclassified Gilliamella]|uniref:hypothetical protein n=1 Tax=unclassified Gilliamella TaxID=2685620 RepID=UPI0013254FEA|nr:MULTISPECIES: hypothetical protein [unclassified Gilliamella]MWN05355.1 hypothetical protein [Gilliamella sp. Pas-s95]MWP62657.1 hypothetical protein [Gilliamella sp. Pas-s25]
MLKSYFLLFALLLFIPTCWADGLTKEQAENLELAGVKLGITEPELVELLKNQYHLSENDFTVSEQQMALPPTKIDGKSITTCTIKNYEVVLNINHPEETLTIQLKDDITHNPPKKMVVYSIYHTMPYTVESAQKVYKELTEKYGKEETTNFFGIKVWRYNSYHLGLSPETEGKFYVSIRSNGL